MYPTPGPAVGIVPERHHGVQPVVATGELHDHQLAGVRGLRTAHTVQESREEQAGGNQTGAAEEVTAAHFMLPEPGDGSVEGKGEGASAELVFR